MASSPESDEKRADFELPDKIPSSRGHGWDSRPAAAGISGLSGLSGNPLLPFSIISEAVYVVEGKGEYCGAMI